MRSLNRTVTQQLSLQSADGEQKRPFCSSSPSVTRYSDDITVVFLDVTYILRFMFSVDDIVTRELAK